MEPTIKFTSGDQYFTTTLGELYFSLFSFNIKSTIAMISAEAGCWNSSLVLSFFFSFTSYYEMLEACEVHQHREKL